MTQGNSTNDHEDHAGDIHSELELNELANVVHNVASPTNGRHYRQEVVVQKDNVGVVLSRRAPVLAHSKTNGSFAERSSIVK